MCTVPNIKFSARATRELADFELSAMDATRLWSLLERLRVDQVAPGDVKRLSSAPCDLWEIRIAVADVQLRLLYVPESVQPLGLEWRIVMVRRKQGRVLPQRDFETACRRADGWESS